MPRRNTTGGESAPRRAEPGHPLWMAYCEQILSRAIRKMPPLNAALPGRCASTCCCTPTPDGLGQIENPRGRHRLDTGVDVALAQRRLPVLPPLKACVMTSAWRTALAHPQRVAYLLQARGPICIPGERPVPASLRRRPPLATTDPAPRTLHGYRCQRRPGAADG